MENRKKIAVLIDADNTSPDRFERIFGEVTLWGDATYRRIYGNWADYNRSALKDKLVEYALTPVQQFNYIKGKNATDIALVIDAMDILYTGEVDGFAIVTNDSDFTRLALRLRESGMIVIGMGDDIAPSSFRMACTDFVVLRESRRIAEELTEQKRARAASSRATLRVRSGSRKSVLTVETAAETPDSADNADNTEPAEAPEAPARAPLSDRELRNAIKEFLYECTEEDGWFSASTMLNKLKVRFPDLDIKDYADLPLFAGKRKIWTTYFLSLGFCENMQKGPSNYLLRLKADERRKMNAEKADKEKAAPAAAEPVPEVKKETAEEKKPAPQKKRRTRSGKAPSAPETAVPAASAAPAEAAEAPAPAAEEKTEPAPKKPSRRGRPRKKAAENKSEKEAD